MGNIEGEKTYGPVIDRCVNRNVPFVLFMQPGTDDLVFFAASPDPMTEECHVSLEPGQPNGFFINFFGNDEPYLAGVQFNYDIEAVNGLLDYMEQHNGYFLPSDVEPTLKSTSRFTHSGILRKLIPELKRKDGKLVISQVTVEVSERPLIEVTLEYFDTFRDAFRFLCFTPETGMWLGASPEILMMSDAENLVTMSLAGTRPSTQTGPWDEKNIREHDVVTQFITDTLTRLDLTVEVGELQELDFGPVSHLCNIISATGKYNIEEVLYALSPTPALAGSPDRDLAVAHIMELEPHSRFCYGGFVGFKYGDRVEAYVNLRSALVAPCEIEGRDAYIYNVYSGGGIMAESDPDSEWEEAMSKCAPLRKAITGSEHTLRPASVDDSVTFRTTSSRKAFIASNVFGKQTENTTDING